MRRPVPRPAWWRQALMLLALAGVVLVGLATAAGVAWVTARLVEARFGWFAWSLVGVLAIFLLVGALSGRAARRGDGTRGGEQEARVARILGRLALMADVAVPRVRVPGGLPPLSWTTQLPLRRPTIVVTQAMAAELDDQRLEAVVAHELAHVLNGDAWIMTLVAGPPTVLLTGLRRTWTHATGKGKVAVPLLTAWALPPLLAGMWLARLVSRHRELAADRGAVALTGSAATLGATLVQLSEELGRRRGRDLRVASTADVFHLLPVRDPGGIRLLWATHPPLAVRLAELDRLEAHLQHAAT